MKKIDHEGLKKDKEENEEEEEKELNYLLRQMFKGELFYLLKILNKEERDRVLKNCSF